ncbi:hypothetical protein BaRGS_00028886, partial [Batillaria attramentaria]
LRPHPLSDLWRSIAARAKHRATGDVYDDRKPGCTVIYLHHTFQLLGGDAMFSFKNMVGGSSALTS